ncbi:MAG TPA: hypothetical protein VK866_18610 [Acidimicrobiales bacterium]|nr:hypothetical protein [Acidimicrobiales bacterium]
MTQHAGRAGGAGERCRWCSRPLPTPAATGRPRRYCRASCRQQAFLARKLAAAHGLRDDEVIVRRVELEALQDRVALLRAALDDLDREGARGGVDAGAALAWLREHADAVAALRVEPVWGERAPLVPGS